MKESTSSIVKDAVDCNGDTTKIMIFAQIN